MGGAFGCGAIRRAANQSTNPKTAARAIKLSLRPMARFILSEQQ